MIDFKKSQKIRNSSVMEGKTKLSMGELMAMYPNGVNVYHAELIGRGENAYPVFLFSENPGVFCFGGSAMKEIVEDWIAQYNGDVDEMNKDLTLFGGVNMRFSRSTTRNGRPFTKVEIL